MKHCLLDTGALGNANFISIKIASMLIRSGASKVDVSQTVAGALKDTSCVSNSVITFDVILNTKNSPVKLVRFSVDEFILDLDIPMVSSLVETQLKALT